MSEHFQPTPHRRPSLVVTRSGVLSPISGVGSISSTGSTSRGLSIGPHDGVGAWSCHSCGFANLEAMNICAKCADAKESNQRENDENEQQSPDNESNGIHANSEYPTLPRSSSAYHTPQSYIRAFDSVWFDRSSYANISCTRCGAAIIIPDSPLRLIRSYMTEERLARTKPTISGEEAAQLVETDPIDTSQPANDPTTIAQPSPVIGQENHIDETSELHTRLNSERNNCESDHDATSDNSIEATIPKPQLRRRSSFQHLTIQTRELTQANRPIPTPATTEGTRTGEEDKAASNSEPKRWDGRLQCEHCSAEMNFLTLAGDAH